MEMKGSWGASNAYLYAGIDIQINKQLAKKGNRTVVKISMQRLAKQDQAIQDKVLF